MSWCVFRRGTNTDTIDENCDPIPLSDAHQKVFASKGKHQLEKSISDIHMLLTDIDLSITSHMKDKYHQAAFHLLRQCELFPTYPLVVLQCSLENRQVWINGVLAELKLSTVKNIIAIRLHCRSRWQEYVDDVKQHKDSTSLVVLVLEDSEKFDADFISNLFHILKWEKLTVSVLVACVASTAFGLKCSFRTLRQFDSFIITIHNDAKLYNEVVACLTHKNRYTLQFSKHVLDLIRQRFYSVEGSFEMIKNVVKLSMLLYTMENPLWCLKQVEKFAYAIECYWILVKRLSPNILVSVEELHDAIQDNPVFVGSSDCSVRVSSREYIDKLSSYDTVQFATFLLKLCERNDKMVVSYLGFHSNYALLLKYRNIFSVGKELEDKCTRFTSSRHDIADLKDKMQDVLWAFLIPFTLFPDAKSFVISETDAFHHLFVDPQLMMEKSLMTQDNDCTRCYKALLESGEWKRISLTKWSTEFYKLSDEQNTDGKQLAFFASASTLERCGIVGATTSTPNGYVDILYHPRLNYP